LAADSRADSLGKHPIIGSNRLFDEVHQFIQPLGRRPAPGFSDANRCAAARIGCSLLAGASRFVAKLCGETNEPRADLRAKPLPLHRRKLMIAAEVVEQIDERMDGRRSLSRLRSIRSTQPVGHSLPQLFRRSVVRLCRAGRHGP
jgi:hypothetical protein